VPLPDTSDSFLRLGGDASAQVQIDAHVDLLCPDCAAAWPVLQQIAANYAKAQVSVNLHVFPLPYHTFAFSAAQGGNVIASLNSSTTAVFNWANALFEGAQVSCRITRALDPALWGWGTERGCKQARTRCGRPSRTVLHAWGPSHGRPAWPT
jgi:hypothetical protein